MTNETEKTPPSKASLSFGIMLVRLKNVLKQGLTDLARPGDAGHSRSVDAIDLTEQGLFVSLAVAEAPVPVTQQVMAGLANQLAGRPIDLVLRDNSCIDVSFSVPAAPLADLRQMIETEIQFRSPFAEAMSLSFWNAREQSGGRWQIKAAVVLKARLEGLIADLRANGVNLGQVWRDGASLGFSAQPEWFNGPRPEPRPLDVLAGLPTTLKLTLAGSAVLLASATVLTVSLWLGAGRLSDQAEAARATISENAQSTADLRNLERQLALSAERLAMTGKMSGLLPDGFWLDQLDVATDGVTLTGYGPSGAEVTRMLTTLPELADIAFDSPVTRDNSQSLERYRISATLVGAAQ